MRYLRPLVFIICLALIGCAPVISKETLNTVDRSITFEEVIKDPSAHTGKGVVFGGTILDTENREDNTVIEVLQEGLNARLRPVVPEESAGRFLVSFKGFRDPAIYSKGRGITIAGKVTGTEQRKLGKGTYTYPVIEPVEHYLWDRRTYGRDGDVGIGIGLGFGYTHID